MARTNKKKSAELYKKAMITSAAEVESNEIQDNAKKYLNNLDKERELKDEAGRTNRGMGNKANDSSEEEDDNEYILHSVI